MRKLSLSDIDINQELLVKDAVDTLSQMLEVRKKIIIEILCINQSALTKEKQTRSIKASGGILKARLILLLKLATYLYSQGLRAEVILYALKYSLIGKDGFPLNSAIDTVGKLKTKTTIDFKGLERALDSGVSHFRSLSVTIKNIRIIQNKGKIEVSCKLA